MVPEFSAAVDSGGSKHSVDLLRSQLQSLADVSEDDAPELYQLRQDVFSLLFMLETVVSMRIGSPYVFTPPLEPGPTDPETLMVIGGPLANEVAAIDRLTWDVAQDCAERLVRIREAEKRFDVVTEVNNIIRAHQLYLLGKLEAYQLYLDNIRQQDASGGGQKQQLSSVGRSPAAVPQATVKILCNTLLEKGVIGRIKLPVPKSVMKYCYVHLNKVDASRVRMELVFRKDDMIPTTAITVSLEELLRLQDVGQMYLENDMVSLHVASLIGLFNADFVIN